MLESQKMGVIQRSHQVQSMPQIYINIQDYSKIIWNNALQMLDG